MKFYPYPKVHTLGKEETDGILDNHVYVQEKVDGANASVWSENGIIKCGKRSSETEDFQGLPEYVKAHKGINEILIHHPEFHLFGEWLVRHSIAYNETAYRKFYLFDIGVWKDGELFFLDIPKVIAYAETYEIECVELLWEGQSLDKETIDSLAGKTSLGAKGEGIVIKPRDPFINKFGNFSYAKFVTQDFKEQNGIVFGGNNKNSDTYSEVYVCNKYMTLARVQKVIHKLEATLDKRIHKEETSRLAMTCYNDMLVEEIWSIQKDVDKISFKSLKQICMKKAIHIFHDILANDIPITYSINK